MPVLWPEGETSTIAEVCWCILCILRGEIMIKMSENEFKMMDLEFRTKASRLCRAKYQEVKMLLSKFIYHLEHTTLLNEHIQGCEPNMSDAEIREMTDRVISGWGEVSFDFGN